MSISENRKPTLHHGLFHLGAAVFTALFGLIYEIFSFGVTSYFMVYAFLIPLVLGALPLLMTALFGKRQPDKGLLPWSCGIAALTVGSLAQGVLQIYGTTNRLVLFYLVLGLSLLLLGLILPRQADQPELLLPGQPL